VTPKPSKKSGAAKRL